MNYLIEITRNNVTPAKFFAEIRFALKQKGIYFGLYLKEFASPSHGGHNCNYRIVDDKKVSYLNGYKQEWPADYAPCQAEILKELPYEYQSYILNFDGSYYNEICEFTFDDDKRGHGYYTVVNKDAE